MASPTNSSKTPPKAAPDVRFESSSITSARSLKQFSIYILGATLFLASTTITRRAIHRRNLRNMPKLFEPNTNPHEHFSPLMDALQALNLATMNVASLGVMTTGGVLWAFDISGLGEMRRALRRRLGTEGLDLDSQKGSLESKIIEKREDVDKIKSKASKSS